MVRTFIKAFIQKISAFSFVLFSKSNKNLSEVTLYLSLRRKIKEFYGNTVLTVWTIVKRPVSSFFPDQFDLVKLKELNEEDVQVKLLYMLVGLQVIYLELVELL